MVAEQKKKSFALQLKTIGKTQIEWKKRWLARHRKIFGKIVKCSSQFYHQRSGQL